MDLHPNRKVNTETRHRLQCARCLDDAAAEYTVSSDIVHINTCFKCAEEARRLGLTVKPSRPRKRAA